MFALLAASPKLIVAAVLAWVAPFVAWVTAQAVPSDPTVSIGALVVQLGLSSVFLWWALQERKERQSTQKLLGVEQTKKDELLERVLPLLTQATEALRDVQEGMRYTVERVSTGTDRREMDTALRRAEVLAGELADVVAELRPPDHR